MAASVPAPESVAVAAQPGGSPQRRCRNCGAAAPGRYCPDCGQATALHPPSVVEFVHEFLGHHVAIEGPLWRTLGALLLTPGRLTVDYFAGRRQRYLPPLRLYLTFSLILFAVSNLHGDGIRLGNEKIEFRPMTQDEAKHLEVFGLEPMHAPGNGDGLFARIGSRIDAMTPDERNARINAGVRQYLPYVLIVLVPVLALLLKGLYWRRRLLYGEHLVVAFHAQTVAFVFAIVSALPLGETIGSLWVVALFVHGTVALRRVYGGAWWSTIAREVVLMLAYSIAIAVALGALALLTLAL